MPTWNDAATAVTPELGTSWYDQVYFIKQLCGFAAPLPPCQIVLTDPAQTVIAASGTNLLRANGHLVWAYVDLQGIYHDSFGRSFTNTFPAAISPDGDIAVKPHSNAYCEILHYNNDRTLLVNADAKDIQLLSGGRALWTVDGQLYSNFTLIGPPDGLVYWPKAADDGMLFYQHRPEGSLVLGGHVIAPPAATYYFGDVKLVGKIYYIVTSPTESDNNPQFLSFTVEQLAMLPLAKDIDPTPHPPIPVPPTPIPPKPPDPIPPKPIPPKPPQTGFIIPPTYKVGR